MKSTVKLSRKKSICSTILQSILPALPVNSTVSPPGVPPASNRAGERCIAAVLCRSVPLQSRQSLGSSPSALISKVLSQGSGWLRFLHGLEEEKRTSPFFRILSLKRLSCRSKTFKHTERNPLSTEPRTLHAHERSVVKRFLFRSESMLQYSD